MGESRVPVKSFCVSVVAPSHDFCCSCSTVCIISSSISSGETPIEIEGVEDIKASSPQMESLRQSRIELLREKLEVLGLESSKEVLGVSGLEPLIDERTAWKYLETVKQVKNVHLYVPPCLRRQHLLYNSQPYIYDGFQNSVMHCSKCLLVTV